MTAPTPPPAEIPITGDLVQRLVAQDRPDLAHLPVPIVDEGWDFVVARLGGDMSVRLPRRLVASDRALHEHMFLAGLPTALPLRVPQTVHVGVPSKLFPHHWRIAEWVPGAPIAVASVAPESLAGPLASMLSAWHRPAPPEAAFSADRSIPLGSRRERLTAELRSVPGLTHEERDQALRVFDAAAAVPAGPEAWIHGDLHARNLVGSDGRLVGVIDFADAMRGDPALDASVAFSLLPSDRLADFAAAATHMDEAAWQRARGWAITIGAWLCADDPGDDGLVRSAASGVRSAMRAGV